MFGINKRKESISPGRIAWNRFSSNISAMVALGWIVVNILLALLGYLITPDSAPFANTQHLELSAKAPGTKVTFVKARKNAEIPEASLLNKMLFGRISPYIEIPVDNFRTENFEVFLTRYTGYKDFEGLETAYSLADIIFPVDSLMSDGDSLVIFRGNDEPVSHKIVELEQIFHRKHVFTRTYWLGTDRFGRDLLSQVIIGARVSLSVGFIAISIALLLGVIMGSLAGFFRGRTDNFIVWLINVVWSIPTLLLVIAITFALGKGFWQIFIAVGLTMWVDVARVVRGQIISLRENEYIEAAKALGLRSRRIIARHLLPNITGPVVVISAANFASAILIEAGLSFLGIGVQPPMPSWGNMIRENYGFIILDKAYLAITPGICIMLLVMAFMIVGNGLRDALDKSPANY